MLDSSPGNVQSTKDGDTVAKEIELENRVENMGAMLLREVASRTNDEVGDGTTTATVFAQRLIGEGMKYITGGANPQELKRGMDDATNQVLTNIKKQSRQITDGKEIRQVATISANGDHTIGKQIAQAVSGFIGTFKSLPHTILDPPTSPISISCSWAAVMSPE